VPAGIYAREYLEQAKLWSAVEKKVVPVDNVRAALSVVEAGNVDAGIVYRTDANISKKVKVAYEVPVREGPAISYPMAVVKATEKPAVARRFLDYLEPDQAGRAFAKAGFIVRK
jgi:molybdate transport system substrate-binding protein